MKREGALIPKQLYRKILTVLPIACVDVIVTRKGKFLLGKRSNKPAQGKWCFIGGRILKGESQEDAVRRKVREETGLKRIVMGKLVGVKETMFKESAQGSSSHTINIVFLVHAAHADAVPSDGQNSELQWFFSVDRTWMPYVRGMLTLEGFKMNLRSKRNDRSIRI